MKHKLRIAGVVIGLCMVLMIFCLVVCGDHDPSLIEAASKADLKQVQDLLEKGVDVDVRDRNGSTALMVACSGQSEGRGQVLELLKTCGGLAGRSPFPRIASQALDTPRPFRILIHGPDAACEYLFEPTSQRVDVVAYWKEKTDERTYLVHSDRVHRWDVRAVMVEQLGLRLTETPKWAEASPDCRLAIVVYEDPHTLGRKRAILGKREPWLPMKEFRLPYWDAIDDFAWSADSRYLVVVEHHERRSTSILGRFAEGLGHPISYYTFFATTIDIISGEEKRMRIGGEVRGGTAAVYGAISRCGFNEEPNPRIEPTPK